MDPYLGTRHLGNVILAEKQCMLAEMPLKLLNIYFSQVMSNALSLTFLATLVALHFTPVSQ